MSIREILGKIKGYLEIDRVFYVLVLLLLSVASFGLGRLSVEGDLDGSPIQKMTPRTSSQVGNPSAPLLSPKTPLETQDNASSSSSKEESALGAYVGSKKGTKYHLPWCGGAQRINEENKIWFADKESAEKAGYTPAGNCPGI